MLLPPSRSLFFVFFLSLTCLFSFSVAPNLFLLLLYASSSSSFTFSHFFPSLTIFSFSSPVPNLFLFLLLLYASFSSSTFFFPIFSLHHPIATKTTTQNEVVFRAVCESTGIQERLRHPSQQARVPYYERVSNVCRWIQLDPPLRGEETPRI